MNDLMIRSGTIVQTSAVRLVDAVRVRLDVRDERGDVTPRTVGIAVMTAIAVAVGVAITAKITAKEATISLD